MENTTVKLNREELMLINSALYSDWRNTYDEGIHLSDQGRARFWSLQQKIENAIAATGKPIEI